MGDFTLDLRDALDRLDESITVYDRDTRLVFINAAGARLFGRPIESLIGHPPWDLVPPGPRSAFREALESVCAGGPKTNLTVYIASFSRWFEVDIYPHPEGALTVAHDITEQRVAEEALRESEARFRAMVEFATEAIVIFSVDTGKFEAVNEAAETLYGISRLALSNIGPLDVSAERQPDGTPSSIAVNVAVQILLKTGKLEQEWAMVGAGGRPFLAHVSARLLPSSVPVLIRASIFDITFRRREEERRGQAQRLAAVGRLASGVAHDFNNMLSVILGYTSVALLDVAPEEQLHSDLEEVRIAGERAAKLARQLLALSSRQMLEPRVIDLSDLVLGTMKMLRMAVGDVIKIDTELSRPGSRVRVDPGQIEQVLLNLAVNARDAMPNGGTITFAIEDVDLALDEVPGAPPGAYVVLAVADTGAGMDSSTMTRIFEPFFTTKAPGKGTGLGLATVFGIVTQSGGQIALRSELGRGTVFHIYLPRTDAAPALLSGASQMPTVLRGKETILVVEDEDQVRAVVEMILAKNGYSVLDAPNGEEGLRLSDANATTAIALLLTDMVMPGMTGRALFQVISAARPEMKVLYLAGDSATLAGGTPCLHKPITAIALLRRVREVLDQAVPRPAGDAREGVLMP